MSCHALKAKDCLQGGTGTAIHDNERPGMHLPVMLACCKRFQFSGPAQPFQRLCFNQFSEGD
jgi:hypothetical protein